MSAQTVGTRAPPVVETDSAFLKKKLAAEQLEEALVKANAKAERLVLKMQALGDASGELGLSCIKLAKFEDGEGVRRGQYSSEAGFIQHIHLAALIDQFLLRRTHR